MKTYTIKKHKIQDDCTEIRFYKNGICQFVKIIVPSVNEKEMAILCNAWLSGELKRMWLG
jgi:hypothetical protein